MSESWREFRSVWQQEPAEKQKQILESLENEEFEAINWWLVEFARDKQVPPEGIWFCWLLRSGRGFGKTRTGSEWVIHRARTGYRRIALVGQTKGDVRDTMIEVEESSILNVSPPGFMPDYEPSKRRLTWPNGAVATIYSGDEPDQLRGPQHDTAWVDELAKFKYPMETWDNLEFGLRLGPDPRVVVTTTPRPIQIVKTLLADPMTVDIVGSSYENVENLSSMFIQRVLSKYENTRLGRQELHGEILDDMPGALWNRELLDLTRVTQHPDLFRIVVAVDPQASSGQTGIIVVGSGKLAGELHGYTLDDVTPEPGVSPATWGKAAVAAYHKWKADAIVAEVNNGGDMVENVIRNVEGGKNVSYKVVRATRGKYTRAEPVAAIFEQKRGHHMGFFADLEDELCNWVPGDDSPNRLDAEVWAYTELMLEEQTEAPAGEVVEVDLNRYKSSRRRRR